MIDNNIIIIFIVSILIINAFFIGYLFGRSINTNGVSNSGTKKSFFKEQNLSSQEANSIAIDDKKFVVDIKTEGLEKKYDSLGDVKTSQEDISNSINKLKNLKR